MHHRAHRAVLVLCCLTLTACFPRLDLASSVAVSCETSRDCPADLVCSQRGRCETAEQAAKGIAEMVVAPRDGLVVSEISPTTFTLHLGAAPTATVSITLDPALAARFMVQPTSVIFTPDNWQQAQTITLQGVRSCASEGQTASEVIFSSAQSADATYSGLNTASLAVTLLDDAHAGVNITRY